MLPDIERLIQLQDIDSMAAAAARVVADTPGQIAALDARLAAAKQAVESARQALAENQASRRSIEKDLAAVQQRLDKYRDQSMAVKTNDEFHAMQHQMAAAKADIDGHESRQLEAMMQADEIGARQKAAEAQLKAEEAAVAAARKVIEATSGAQQAVVAECAARRTALVAQMDPRVVSLFERLAKSRAGVGMARAEQERCVVCQVRLRPMVYSVVRNNSEILQCDSCQRILYYVAPPPPDAKPADTPPA